MIPPTDQIYTGGILGESLLMVAAKAVDAGKKWMEFNGSLYRVGETRTLTVTLEEELI